MSVKHGFHPFWYTPRRAGLHIVLESNTRVANLQVSPRPKKVLTSADADTGSKPLRQRSPAFDLHAYTIGSCNWLSSNPGCKLGTKCN